MPRLLRFLVALLGCLHLCGGHWGVLQGVAWSRMLVDYSAEHGLLEGARQTFDGEHPCCMCESIAKGKKQESERKPDSLTSSALVLKEAPPAKAVALPPVRVLELPAPSLAAELPAPLSPGEGPPVPPPRFVV